ncbi:MAG: 50S ribosomal protein L1 [Candidatus Marsarchaeota archaeon]|jgi:large subunit ribosomal protein L1|nr:50S ribosomal protein L1 [Candidatus Marsarchaeota archaeon]
MAIGIEEFSKFMSENKGKRKFKQSVELAINFKGIDFTKQDNRLNLEVNLPNGKGKSRKVAVFAVDKNVIEDANKNGINVIQGNELESISKDQKRLNDLIQYDLVAQPSLMPTIARSLGQFLGPRGKMPKPLLPGMSLGSMSGELQKRIDIKSKGKYLPTVHTLVGSEDMEPQKLYDNIDEVIKAVVKKVGQGRIRSAYVKLTMSKPIKFM